MIVILAVGYADEICFHAWTRLQINYLYAYHINLGNLRHQEVIITITIVSLCLNVMVLYKACSVYKSKLVRKSQWLLYTIHHYCIVYIAIHILRIHTLI